MQYALTQNEETGGEQSLTQQQLVLLRDQGIRETVCYVQEHSPFYRRLFAEEGIAAADITDAEALRQVPFTTKDDLGTHERDFWCVPDSQIADISTTSGTSGVPTLYPMTNSDIRRLGHNEFLSFSCAGISREDTVLLAVTMDRCFIAGLAYYEGLRETGATVLRCGAGAPGLLLTMLERLQPRVIVSVPSFLKRVAEYAAEQRIDVGDSSVEKLVCIGEPLRGLDFSLNPLGRILEEQWNAQLFSTYGITELATSFCECSAGRGGHLHPSLLHAEIVDEEGRPLPEGEVGELVATTFGVEAMPLVRFRTGDMTFMTSKPCSCGRVTPRIGPILGRRNQMMKIKGTTLYPPAVQRILDGIAEVRDYVMIVTSPAPLSDELEILVALERESRETSELILQRLQGELKFKPRIRIESIETIERLQFSQNLRKKQRFVDQRTASTD